MKLVELRPEGLYCAAGDFYIDPWRSVESAVITHAHADHARSGHQYYVASNEALPVLRHRLGDVSIQGWEYGQINKMGNASISLHPAGHILGSAQVRIEANGHVVVVTGDFKRSPDPTCLPFEVVKCDVLVTEATFSLPVYHWPPARAEVKKIWAWWQDCKARGYVAVLGCYALGKAQRVLAELLQYTEDRVLLHGAVDQITRLYRQQEVNMVSTAHVAEVADYNGELVIAPPGALNSAWMKRFKKVETGFCSGWMQIRGNRRRRGTERGFVISDHADWPELLKTIDECEAKEIFLTHGRTDAIVRFLKESGKQAFALETLFSGTDDINGTDDASEAEVNIIDAEDAERPTEPKLT